MHLTVTKSALLKELNLIQGVVEKKSTIPVLSNVLLETADNELMIKGTDLDVSVSTRCQAEVREAGSVCIQAKKLFEIVRSLPETEIEIKQSGNDQVTIICERSRFKMLGVPKENFPEIKSFAGEPLFLPAELIRTFIARTSFSITNEESRYALNGAKLELTEKGIRLVATDGHRLSFIEKQTELGNTNLDVLVPKKTLLELAKLSSETNDPIEFAHHDNYLFFKVGKRLLSSRTLSGQFPNYDLVLPKENNNKIVVDSGRAAAAIRRVALMADERSHAVKLEIGDNLINVTSQSAEAGEAGEQLSVDYAGPVIASGFNAQYLLDFFNVIQDGEVVMEFKDGSSQAQLKSKDDTEYDFRYIVMPMRI